MHYGWKDVRDDVISFFGVGIIFTASAVMVGMLGVVFTGDTQLGQPAKISYVQLNLVLWGMMFGFFVQIHVWDETGVTVRSHGWRLKLAQVVGSNIAFFAPFLAAWFFF